MSRTQCGNREELKARNQYLPFLSNNTQIFFCTIVPRFLLVDNEHGYVKVTIQDYIVIVQDYRVIGGVLRVCVGHPLLSGLSVAAGRDGDV